MGFWDRNNGIPIVFESGNKERVSGRFSAIYQSGLSFEVFQQMTEYLHPSLKDIGFKSSNMRFAAKQASRRSALKAELTFEPYILQ